MRKPEPARKAQALARVISRGTDRVHARIDALAEFVTVKAVSGAAGRRPTATTDDDAVGIVEAYGVASRPPAGARALTIAIGGDSSFREAVGLVAPSSRPATESGELVLYTVHGQTIRLTEDGDIVLIPAPGRKIYLGATEGTEPPAKGPTTRTEINKLISAIAGAIGPDIGAAIKAAVAGAFPFGAADLSATSTEVL